MSYFVETCTAGIFPHMIEDGYCNDESNNPECNYDGGDCCGSCIITNYCTNCSCINDVTNDEIDNPLVGNGFCNNETNNVECSLDFGDCCPYSDLSGNYVCNDQANILECQYDGGDCCLSNLNTSQCLDCTCFISGAIASPGFPQGYGDNFHHLSWLIQIPLGRVIEIDFVSFHIGSQYSSGC